MKHRICCALLLALCLLLSACAPGGGKASPKVEEEPKELRIAIASDLHYLSQELTDNGPLFQEVVARGDGKLMLDIEAITEAFTEQMIAEHPDLVSGFRREIHQKIIVFPHHRTDAGIFILQRKIPVAA